jgi:MOSC domain-containing protein YiiM
MTTLAQGDLPSDLGVLRAAAHNRVHVPFAQQEIPSVGVYATIVRGGTIRRGDAVTLDATA